MVSKIKTIVKKIVSLDFLLDKLAGMLRFFMDRNPLIIFIWLIGHLDVYGWMYGGKKTTLSLNQYSQNFNQRHPYFSALTSIVLIISILSGTVYFAFLRGQQAEAGWWDETWMYRKKIELANSAGSTQTNTQVKILNSTDLSALVSGGKLQADLDDLRFADRNGKILKYWIEDGTNNSVDVWVLMSSVPTSGATVYMYYGNASATAGKSTTGTPEFPGLSCTSIKTSGENNSGAYYIDPNGNQVSDAYQVYCDQTTDGGGWTLVYKYVATGGYSQAHILAGSSSKNAIIAPLNTERADGRNASAYTDFWTADGMSWLTYMKKYDNNSNITDTKWLESDLASNVDWGTDVYFAGKAQGCQVMPGTVSLKSSWGGSYGSTTYRYVGYTDGRGYLAAQSGTYTDTCGQGAGNLLTSSPGEAAHIWYAGSDYTNKNKDRCTWTCWEAADNYTHAEGYSGREWYVKGTKTVSANISAGAVGSEEKSAGPVGYWKLDDGYGTTSQDAGPNDKDMTFSGTPTWQTEDKCVSGKCLYFDGTASELAANTEFDYDVLKSGKEASSWSLSIWVRPGGSQPGVEKMILGRAGCHGGIYAYQNDFRFAIKSDGCWVNAKEITYTPPDMQSWHHLVAVYDNRAMSFYADGKLVGTDTFSVTMNAYNNTLYLGGIGDYEFKGTVDEPKVYNYARTAAQIKAEYNVGLAGISSNDGAGLAVGDNSPKWLSEGLVGYWKMDESSWGSVVDSSGQGKHGIKYGDATVGAGKFAGGGVFDGSGDYVDVTGFNLGISSTISVWMKNSAYDGDIPISLNGDNYASGPNIYFAANKINWNIGDSDANSLMTGYPDSNWHHFVIVSDAAANNVKLYMDGEYKGTATYRNTTITNGQVRIGGYHDGGYGSSGTLDDFRLYNRALSPVEVKDLYNWAPGPVAHWKMDEKSENYSYDSSGYGRTGTLENGTTWTEGKYGGAAQFDGSDDLINYGNPSTLTGLSQISMEAWIYPTSFPDGAASIYSLTLLAAASLTMTK